MKKRIWSILLTLCLAFTLLPTAALAEEPDGGSTVEMEAITSITAVGNGSGNWLNGANWGSRGQLQSHEGNLGRLRCL